MADISKIKVERIADGVQTGDLCYSLRTEKEGWLLCDGTSYSVSDYPNLFNVIGYTFGGSGDNFNVPNYKGKFLQMINDSQTLGQNIKAGLPNITGHFGGVAGTSVSGAFSIDKTDISLASGTNGTRQYLSFNASRSSSIYGKSNTVQPPASIVNYFIKY